MVLSPNVTSRSLHTDHVYVVTGAMAAVLSSNSNPHAGF